MAAKTDELLSAGAGLVATLVVGVGVVLSETGVGGDPTTVGLWWAAYGLYVAVFLVDSGLLRIRRPWPPGASMAVLLACGVAVWLLAPGLGWTPLLFVVTAASAAFDLSRTTLVLLIAVQTIALAVGGARAGWSTADTVPLTVAYVAFQAFAAVVVLGIRRESAARAAVAAAHAELRAATTLLAVSSRNAERLRIARDLHDVLGHQLTALALELEVASHHATGEALEHVRRARDVAKGLLSDVRDTVGELRDAPVGLEPTLREVVEGVPGLDVALVVDERAPVDEARRIVVLRCVQEALTNTMRHASATRLEVELVSDEDGLVLRAHDDGVGVRRVEPGNGLTGMSERIEELGGELTLESAPGRGFTVTARVPA